MKTQTGKAIVKLINEARRRLVCAENDVVMLRATIADIERKVATLDDFAAPAYKQAQKDGPK